MFPWFEVISGISWSKENSHDEDVFRVALARVLFDGLLGGPPKGELAAARFGLGFVLFRLPLGVNLLPRADLLASAPPPEDVTDSFKDSWDLALGLPRNWEMSR